MNQTQQYHYKTIPAKSYQEWADAAAAQERIPVLPEDKAHLLEQLFNSTPQSLEEYRQNLDTLADLQMEINYVLNWFQRETSGLRNLPDDYMAQFKI